MQSFLGNQRSINPNNESRQPAASRSVFVFYLQPFSAPIQELPPVAITLPTFGPDRGGPPGHASRDSDRNRRGHFVRLLLLQSVSVRNRYPGSIATSSHSVVPRRCADHDLPRRALRLGLRRVPWNASLVACGQGTFAPTNGHHW
jgi:hypothetical protein